MAYYRGDYYRSRGRLGGDYYRGRMSGDPFWGAIWRGITTVGKIALGIPSTAGGAGAAAGTAAATTGGKIASTLPQVISRIPLPSARIPSAVTSVMKSPTARNIGAMVAAGTIIEMGGRLYDAVTGQPIRRRRTMNPGNVKALRRSLRRVTSFGRLCASARNAVGHAATQLQYGRRRTSGGTALATARASSRR